MNIEVFAAGLSDSESALPHITAVMLPSSGKKQELKLVDDENFSTARGYGWEKIHQNVSFLSFLYIKEKKKKKKTKTKQTVTQKLKILPIFHFNLQLIPIFPSRVRQIKLITVLTYGNYISPSAGQMMLKHRWIKSPINTISLWPITLYSVHLSKCSTCYINNTISIYLVDQSLEISGVN